MRLVGRGSRKVDVQRRSPPSMRSSTKKQFSSSWKAYRRLTINGWSTWERGRGQCEGNRGTRMCAGSNLFQQPAFLDDIGHGLHLDALCLVDILESIKLLGLLVLDDADLSWEGLWRNLADDDEATHLSKGTLANASKEHKVEEVGVSIKVDWLDDGEHDEQENEERCAPAVDSIRRP